MSIRLMEGCLNMTDALTNSQNVDAQTTMLFGQVEGTVVDNCVNDPDIIQDEKEIDVLVTELKETKDSKKRANIEAQIQELNQDLQTKESTDQQSEQQWDAKTQIAQNQSTMMSTDVQQTVQIEQAGVIAALTYMSNLLASSL